MAIYFKCHKCGAYIIDMQGENSVDYEMGVYQCPECGELLNIDDDTVEYDYELFNSTGLCM